MRKSTTLSTDGFMFPLMTHRVSRMAHQPKPKRRERWKE